MKSFLPYSIIVAVFLIATGAAVELYRNADQPPPSTGKLAFGHPGAQPAHVRGPIKAPVALEEFGDFECETCAAAYPALKKAKEDYGDKLSQTFRQYPLAQHKRAMEAARTAEAAGLQGKFWEMHDTLYENRFFWLYATDTRATFRSYAEKLGLDLERFQKDMDSEEVAKRIAADRERVTSLELNRTPSIFINGDPVTKRPITIDLLHSVIDAALGKAK